MSKRLILVLALVFVVGFAFAAYAEVQNVKVSGDINMMGIARNNFNLANGVAGDKASDNESNIVSQVRVRIDADLTDNVMATVRLINERAWDEQTNAVGSTSDTNNHVDLDLAYVTLKEFLYSPLSLTIGRQELRYGNALIIGNARNYGSNTYNRVPSDLIERKAFDAIKATLNYDPLVVDLIAARIDKGLSTRNTNVNLFGINATYSINKNTSVQGYLFDLQHRDRYAAGAGTVSDKADQIYTVGALVNTTTIKNLTASVEGAMQYGRYKNTIGSSVSKTPTSEYRGYAVQTKANYAIPCEKMKKYAPTVGAMYTYLSGANDGGTQETWHQWNSMFYDQALNNITYAILPFSGLSVWNIMASAKPMDDVILMANWGIYNRTNKASSMSGYYANSDGTTYLSSVSMTDKKFLGNALDLTANYAYTEDVSFGLTAGWFFAGRAFAKGTDNTGRKNASQLIGSMKVTF